MLYSPLGQCRVLTIITLIQLAFCAHAKPWHKDFPENQDDLRAIQNHVQALFSQSQSVVVSIEADEGAGSGVVVSEDGLVLTAAHVIEERGKEMLVVFPDGKKVKARSLGGSVFSDAGMLKISDPGPWPHASLAKVNQSVLGDWCYALGHPSGFNADRGLVLRVGRIIGKVDETMQTDCKLLGGDSGGPLFDFNGDLIAIHSRISQEADENFHIPIEAFLSNWDFFMTEDFFNYERLKYGGFLGVACSKSKKGLVVLGVVPQSAADRAGLQEGDQLNLLDGVTLDSREKLSILISKKAPGESVVIDFSRSGKMLSLKITLTERPLEE